MASMSASGSAPRACLLTDPIVSAHHNNSAQATDPGLDAAHRAAREILVSENTNDTFVEFASS
jgi:hypothetical protein